MTNKVNTCKVYVRNQQSKKNEGEVRNVVYALRPLLAIGQILGVFRFHFKNNELMPTNVMMKCTVICIVGLYSVLCGIYLHLYIPKEEMLSFQEYLNLFLFILNMLYYILTLIVHSIAKTCVNVQIIFYFAELDSKLRFSVRKSFYKRSRCYATCIALFLFLISLTFATWYYLISGVGLVTTFMVDIVVYLQDIETFLVCVFVYMLKVRLIAINQNLADIARDSERNNMCLDVFGNSTNERVCSQQNASKLSSVAKLREQSLAYALIGKTCDVVNCLYNFQILILLVTTFMAIISTLCALLVVFRSEIILTNIVITITWCGTKVVYVFVMCFVCESLSWTRIKTRDLVNTLVMDYRLPANARAQAKAFMDLIDAWPLHIYVYDMFAVDLSLLLKFVSVSTTYLIILIQIS